MSLPFLLEIGPEEIPDWMIPGALQNLLECLHQVDDFRRDLRLCAFGVDELAQRRIGHHGVFDLGYLRLFPNMVVMAPGDESDLGKMLEFALAHDAPVSIRYPKANVRDFDGKPGRLTEMDALVAYLQMLGTLVDFKLYDDKADLR